MDNINLYIICIYVSTCIDKTHLYAYIYMCVCINTVHSGIYTCTEKINISVHLMSSRHSGANISIWIRMSCIDINTYMYTRKYIHLSLSLCIIEPKICNRVMIHKRFLLQPETVRRKKFLLVGWRL